MELPLSRAHIPALDGLRFLAALLVLLAHGYGYVVRQGSTVQPNFIELIVMQLADPGMTLFFVLSGFVIHLNYRDTAGNGWSGTYDFFVARFSRLYPLFLVVFGVEFFRLLYLQAPQHGFTMLWPLLFYLTFTQTWIFITVDGHPLLGHYAWFSGSVQATGAMWSLSIEALFYAAYPWLARPLAHLRGRWLVLTFLAIAMADITYYTACNRYIGELHQLSQKFFPDRDVANYFVTWLTFYSPVGRMLEFLLGVLAAQWLLSHRPYNSRASLWVAPTIAVALISWYLACFLIPIPFGPSYAAVLVALLILSTTQVKSWVSYVLGRTPVVRAGEASYSIYLLHWYIMALWAGFYAASLPPRWRIAIYITGVIATIVISRWSYLVFERPAQRWLRHKLRSRPVVVRKRLAGVGDCWASGLGAAECSGSRVEPLTSGTS